MDINRFTEKAQEALADANRRATRNGQPQVDVEHLLVALLDQDGGLAPSILRKANINVENLRRRAEEEVERLPKVSSSGGEPDRVSITGRLNRVLTRAEDEAKRMKDDYVSVEHVLLAVGEEVVGAHARDQQRNRNALQRARHRVVR